MDAAMAYRTQLSKTSRYSLSLTILGPLVEFEGAALESADFAGPVRVRRYASRSRTSR